MKLNALPTWATVAMVVPTSLAGRVTPIDLRSRQSGAVDPGAMIRAGLDAIESTDVARLASTDFPLDRIWKNEILFDGDIDGGESVTQLTVTCIDCYTKGSITVDVWEDLFDPSLEFTFNDAEAFVLMGVNVTASERVVINLFTSQSPIGVGIPGLNVGVYFAIDLILSFNADMDLSGGFWVDFPEHASLELGIFNGDLDDHTFDGTRTGLLPVTVNTAYGKFQADLRLAIQAGIETDNDLFGIGAGALLGVYANVVELIATLEKTPSCDLELEAEYNMNIGGFAKLSVDIGPTVIGVTPTASTTILTAPIVSTCLVSGGGAVPTTTLGPHSPSITSASVVSQTTVMPSSGSTSSLQQPSMTISSSQHQSTVSAAATFTPAPTTTTAPQLMPYPTLSPPVGGKGCAGKGRPQAYTVTRCALNVVNCPEGYGQEIVATRLAMAHAKGQVKAAKVIGGIPTPSVLTGGVIMTTLPTPIVNALVL